VSISVLFQIMPLIAAVLIIVIGPIGVQFRE